MDSRTSLAHSRLSNECRFAPLCSTLPSSIRRPVDAASLSYTGSRSLHCASSLQLRCKFTLTKCERSLAQTINMTKRICLQRSRQGRSDRLHRRWIIHQNLVAVFLSLLVLFITTPIAQSAKHPATRIKRPSTTLPSPSAAASVAAKSTSTSAWRRGLSNAAASACAAACCKTLLQPMDTIKTFQQYHPVRVTLWQAAKLVVSSSTSSTPPLQAASTAASAARRLWSCTAGLANLYAGLGVTVVGAMPSVGIYFGVYSYCKHRFLQDTSSPGTGSSSTSSTNGRQQQRPRPVWMSIAASAAIGNTVASFSRVPYEVAKQKLQMGLYDTTWLLLQDAVSSPRNLVDLLFPKGGVWIQMLRDVPYAVVTLLVYESLQQYVHQRQQLQLQSSSSRNKNVPMALPRTTATTPRTKSPLRDAWIGGLAGGVGSWVTNPMDVIKTRLQTNSALYDGSVARCARAIYAQGGTMAFLRGAVPRLLHKVPANALFFLFYEFFQHCFLAPSADNMDTTRAAAAAAAAASSSSSARVPKSKA